jgi:hypothetical protein
MPAMCTFSSKFLNIASIKVPSIKGRTIFFLCLAHLNNNKLLFKFTCHFLSNPALQKQIICFELEKQNSVLTKVFNVPWPVLQYDKGKFRQGEE